MSIYILQVTQVSKSFSIYESSKDRLLEMFIGTKHHRQHEVLKNINFYLSPGESVGIVGRNGSGKSTFLKLIMGVLLPDAGQICIEGRISGLLELGTGFDLNLSGLDNIYINSQLLGMSSDEIEQKLQMIIVFSELGEAINDPVRTYSSGMQMRLGFAIAIHVNPKCFILDEALAVGDAAFQQKCLKALQEHRAAGGSLLVVSHDLNTIQILCNRVLLIDNGEIIMDGAPSEVCQSYLQLLAGYTHNISNKNYGRGQALIKNVDIRHQGISCSNFLSGSFVTIHIKILSMINRTIQLGILIKDRFGQHIFGINTKMMDESIFLTAGKKSEYAFTLPLSISPGQYTLTVALHGNSTHLEDCEHWWDDAIQFNVQGFSGRSFSGICDLPTDFQKVNS
jgi:lipopolysaccharide transport system ATP-binding protein